MVPSVRHFENLTLWIQLRLGLHDCAWKVTHEHSQNLAQLSMTIFSKFWSRDRYPLCIYGSRPRCFTCIAEQVTSEVVDMFSQGGRPLACRFANASVEMTKFVRSALKTMLYWHVDPDRVLSNHRDSSHVGSCHLTFAGWISPIPLRLIISISTDYIPPLLTKYGVYNADKYFSRNK